MKDTTAVGQREVARPAYDVGDRSMIVTRQDKADDLANLGLSALIPFQAKDPAEWHVLDIGSGFGQTSFALAKRCRSVVGLEPTSDLFEHAVMRLKDSGQKNVTFKHQGVESLTEQSAYDAVFLDNVLEHLPDQPGALSRIAQSLKPGGVLYIVVPNKLWPIEVHYGLPFLSYLPVSLANKYLRLTGRGVDYTDASYAPTLWKLKSLLRKDDQFEIHFVLPADLNMTTSGSPLHYRLGVWALTRIFHEWVDLVGAEVKDQIS